MSPTVVVLSGGLSHEREVSLRSGRRVSQALRSRGLDVIESDVDPTLIQRLGELSDPVVFPLLHGGAGEDGSLREVLALLDIPFVGSLGSACRVAFDKSIATTVVADAGVTTPRQVALPHETFRELGAAALVEALGRQIGFPMMVKPSRGGSALGATKVDTAAELPAAMVGAFAYGAVAVVESFVEGVEITVAVIDRGQGPQTLPAVEIRPDSGVYDYASRYTAGATRFLCPAELSDPVAERAAQTALTVHRALGLTDISRTDLIVTADGTPTFLEVNVSPGMTETSAVPLAIEAAGWSLGKMSADLVAAARPAPRGGVRGLRQALVLALGGVVGLIMLGLGVWQLNVYGAQGAQVSERRAAEPAVALSQVAQPGQAVQDGYGRTVTFTGRYDPQLQVVIPLPDQPERSRVLTAVLLPDGGALPVVRGEIATGATPPAPPSGTVSGQGILLASETAVQTRPGASAPVTEPGSLTAVQLPVLAQRWSPPLVSGYVTLDASGAKAQGLEPATAALPQGEGRSRNAAYALQWWIFAAFAVGLAVKMARDLGRRDDYEELAASEPEALVDSQPAPRTDA